MGSGNKRKDNDKVKISKVKGTGGSSGGVRTQYSDALCPTAFVVKEIITKEYSSDTIVSLQGNEMYIRNEKIGDLSKKEGETIEKCGEKGIVYRGRIIMDPQKRLRVRFERHVEE